MSDSRLSRLLAKLRVTLSDLGIRAKDGLGNELFNFVSALTPIVNVDLLVYNNKGQFLLAMRNDPHCGKGWHVPGGCIRFRETFDERIKKVASQELCLADFTYEKEPIKVFEIFSNKYRDIANQDERAHFITLVFKCNVPDSYVIDNGSKNPSDAGFLKWFDKLPSDLLSIQECYKKILG